MTEQLKPLPCAFCGKQLIDWIYESISCFTEGCAMFGVITTIDKWNTRALKQCEHDFKLMCDMDCFRCLKCNIYSDESHPYK